jgi:transposase
MKKVKESIIEGKKIFIGLEDSKRMWKLCVRCEGMVVHELSMPTEYEGLRNYLTQRYPGCTIRVMYEAGFQGFWLHDLLVQDGFGCVVTPPHTVVEEKGSKVKTDKRDARRLAMNLEKGDYKSCTVPDREQREDRQVSRLLMQTQTDITRTLVRIRMLLSFNGIRYCVEKKAWTWAEYQRLLALPISETLKTCISVLVKRAEQLRNDRESLKKQLVAMKKKGKYERSVRCFSSVPGIGVLTAIRLALEWGNMTRFKTKEGFSSFLGLTPREISSGEQRRQGRITRQGNGAVRAWLIEAAWIAIKKDAALLDVFRRIWNRNGSKKKAIVAVARKMALRMRALWLTNQTYELGVVG